MNNTGSADQTAVLPSKEEEEEDDDDDDDDEVENSAA